MSLAKRSNKSSVITKEIENMNKMVDYWWDENGPARPLHTINKLKNKLMHKSLVGVGSMAKDSFEDHFPLKGLKILDAGCGGGLCSESLVRLGAEVVGIDPSEEMIKIAKEHACLDESLKTLKYLVTTVEEHAETHQNAYDIVISSGVLEHLTEYDLYLEACARCLKPGGSIFISTFNKTFLALFFGIWMAEYVMNIVPRGSHDYSLFISPEEVSNILEKYGCFTHDVTGLFINPITSQWYPIFPSIHYYLHAVKIE